MVAKNTAETDDQIIDLTELIEKGEVPANDLSAQSKPSAHTEAEAEQEALNAQLRDLNDGSNVGDAEFDDLLAQMDIKNDGETDPSDVALDFAPPTTLTDHTVDPNEQLNMPGMGDVDNLLNSLDIPPQPGEREPEAAAPANADQAVDALLNDFNAAAPAEQAAAPAAQPAEAQSSIPDLDELLASVSPASSTGNLGGIDDLLNADRNAGPAQAPTAADTTFSDDDLDSLLDAAPSPLQSAAPAPAPAPAPVAAPAPAPAAAPLDANTDLGFDLDNLLAAAAEDLQGGPDTAQPQVAPQSAPAPASNADTELDIDSLLAAAPDAGDNANVDLDSLLAAAAEDLQGTPDAPQDEAASPSAAPEVADLDIDSLLAAGAPDAAPEADVADASVDAEVDFDSLLAAMSSDEAITGGAQEGVSDVLLHPELELMADMQPEGMPDPLSEPMPELLPEQEPGPDLDPDLQAQTEETEELSADFDALLAEVTAEAAEDQTDAAQTDLPQADMIDQQESDVLETTLAPESAEGEDISLLEPDENLPSDVSAQPEFADADMPQVTEKPAFDPSMYDLLATPAAAAAAVALTAAAVPEAEIEAVREQAKEASCHAIDAFAQAFDASNRAAEAVDMVHQLASRVERCEHALQEAGERIIALETALESQIHAFNDLAAASLPRQELENMFVEGHPLHQYLMNCIEKAVAVALASAPDAEPNAEDAPSLVEEKLQPVVTAARSASARLDALESRLDALEPRFNDRVERAAAAAAARILREEIGRLIEE